MQRCAAKRVGHDCNGPNRGPKGGQRGVEWARAAQCSLAVQLALGAYNIFLMNRFQARLVELTDADWAWWPLVHLRPAKYQLMTGGFVAKLTLVYGTMAALLLVALIWNGGERNPAVLLSFALLAMVAFFVVYRLTFARWWNERATQFQQAGAVPPAA